MRGPRVCTEKEKAGEKGLGAVVTHGTRMEEPVAGSRKHCVGSEKTGRDY